ncbi:predicted protein [Nematostella vectensis]|uniref:Uncharacterized protein n=1 Tax=Nematostella vectensis TaxID=45351 RepID=A7S2U2_NEMVE|nr:predicted protein [Nematostella vectensis]|eukprot:XP_001634014.1 predicted protein [Nematostella vectensis]
MELMITYFTEKSGFENIKIYRKALLFNVLVLLLVMRKSSIRNKPQNAYNNGFLTRLPDSILTPTTPYSPLHTHDFIPYTYDSILTTPYPRLHTHDSILIPTTPYPHQRLHTHHSISTTPYTHPQFHKTSYSRLHIHTYDSVSTLTTPYSPLHIHYSISTPTTPYPRLNTCT